MPTEVIQIVEFPQSDWNETNEKSFKYIKNKPDLDSMNEKIDMLESQIADMLYEPISIGTFSLNSEVRTVEIGTKITEVTLSWTINRDPKTLTLDEESLDVALRKKTISDLEITYNNNKTWKLVATGDRDETSTKTTSKINFYNGVYYGATTKPDEYNRDFILSLTKELRSNYKSSFSVNAGTTSEGKYVYYCQPTRFGVCFFKDGGFDFGNHLVGTVSFENSSGYTEDYYIYESDYSGLGSLTITVKDEDS